MKLHNFLKEQFDRFIILIILLLLCLMIFSCSNTNRIVSKPSPTIIKGKHYKLILGVPRNKKRIQITIPFDNLIAK